jgi:alkylation response protein AidB-like acyl-CoA dehydrogenase
MDFNWTEDEAAFRAEVRSAIERYADPAWGPEDFSLPRPELMEPCRAFCAALASEGLLTPNWPTEYGGRNSSPWEQLIVSEEMHGANEPRGPQYMNVNWIGPAIMASGTDEQKELHLPKIAAGEVFWCQGFSEPDAGSDLASMRTTALREGDEYVINGQKIWTSYAHVADYCFLLARTNLEAQARHGISALLVPMDTPGIEVRDIPNVAGEHVIHEMFFNDVRVPTSCLLGEEDQGWPLVLASLANERIGIARFELSSRVLEGAVAKAWDVGGELPNERDQHAVGRAFAMVEAARMLNYVAVQERATTTSGPRPAASISRVAVIAALKNVAITASELLGPDGLVDPDIDEQAESALATPIAAGSIEMQLNIISRLSLALPRG